MKPFIAIIGGRDSGKSTIIRCVTGAKYGQFRGTILDQATLRTIEVIGSSPQEKSMTLTELQKILKTAARNASCNGVVCALQPTKPTVRLSMEDVLQEARSNGLKVYAYILDPEYFGRTGQAAAIAARVQAIGMKTQVLDGRRFAQQNAATICLQTKIAN
jgi:ABC-type branched-subunit amino acid transport system ATPase component